MTSHPNFDRTQAALNASRQGDYAPAFDAFTDDVLMENGPGAGPWHRARGKDDLALLLLLELASSLGETFHQDGQCAYADDRVAISLIHETGTAPSGDRFDNLAVYLSRLRPDGQTERLWTVDLDAEHCEAFWTKTRHTLEGLFLTAQAAPPRRQIGPFVRQLNRSAGAHTHAISGHGSPARSRKPAPGRQHPALASPRGGPRTGSSVPLSCGELDKSTQRRIGGAYGWAPESSASSPA